MTTTAGFAFTSRLLAEPLSAELRAARLAEPGFGTLFSEHMVTVEFDPTRGWHDAAVVPYGPLVMDPATSVLHYGQAIFEGLKAYAQPDGSIAAFRPEENAARFARSARRLGMPALPEELFLGALQALVEVDRDWVPTAEGTSLYLRPLQIATDTFLGVRPSLTYRFLLIASPVGQYLMSAGEAVSVWLSTEYIRAAPGGTGEAKCAGNYAATFLAQAQAAEQGCGQVVWLDAAERRYVEEMGGMNLFLIEGDGRLVTPALTGTLLPGVTRAALLQLGRDLGLRTEERRVSVEEWEEGCATGRFTEAFACGTAAVLAAIGSVRHDGGGWTVGDGDWGPVTRQLRQALVDVQYGHAPDPHGWRRTLVPAPRS